MSFLFLYDPEFLPEVLNCNFSSWNNPTLSAGPSQSDLYRLVMQARRGDRAALAEYADTMHCTLRPVALETFLRIHGPRAIEFRDWFYSKLYQYFEILLHDSIEVRGTGPEERFRPPKTDRPWEEGVLEGSGPDIHPEDLEKAFSAESYGNYHWQELVHLAAWELAAASSAQRLEKVRARVQQFARRRQTQPTGAAASGWSDNTKRDRIILAGLQGGTARPEICKMLDEQGIPVTAYLKRKGITTWVDGWTKKEFRQNIQSLFSHVWSRKSVN